MKAVINVKATEKWIEEKLGLQSTLAIPIVNKELIDYFFDLIQTLNVEEVLILNDEYRYINQGKFGIKVTHQLVRSDLKVDDIRSRITNFLGDEQMLYLDTLNFVHWDIHNDNLLEFLNEDIDNFLVTNSNNTRLHVEKLSNVGEYFNLNLKILKKYSNSYCLPGYSGEGNIQYGQLCSVDTSAVITGKCNISNFTLVAENVKVTNSIIGMHSYIAKNSEVIDSILTDNVVLGDSLYIKNKLIANGLITNPENGKSIRFDEVDTNLSKRSLFKNISEVLKLVITTILVVIKFPFFKLLTGKEIMGDFEKSISNSKFQEIIVWNNCISFKNRSLFYRLGLDKYPLLVHSLKGNIRLVGDCILNSYSRNSGVYSYAESYCHLEDVENVESVEIHDRYYGHERSVVKDLMVIINFYHNRLTTSLYE
ncbi:MAG: hypothetical protein BM556_05450 [Bacteriovorax sp. MedPE-SWde]|nr:MAG: hypothetical protein BM556_05450 [Bacteriovorax sp. MedPE-SWde]